MTVRHSDSAHEYVVLRRGKVDSLTVYDVTESELQDLEHGGPANIYLNFAIFSLSSAFAFLIAIFSTNIESIKTFCFFVIVTVIGLIGGVILLFIWKKSRKTTSVIIQRIRDRAPKDDEPMDLRHAKEIDSTILKDVGKSNLTGKSILWVDDKPEGNKYSIEYFKGRGIKVDIEVNTESGLQAAQQKNYDLIISDVSRGSDREAGIRFIERFSRENKHCCPVVFFTSRRSMIRSSGRLKELGAEEVVSETPHLLEVCLNLLSKGSGDD